jgi:outer membrane lipoprotein-sorting protein
MTSDDLERKLKKLGRDLAPGSSVAPNVLSRIGGVTMETTVNNQLRRWIMRASIGLAACVAIAFGLTTLLSHQATAWADVLAKVDQTRALTFDIDIAAGKEPAHVYIKGDLMRTEPSPVETVIWNRSTGKMVMLNSTNKSATVMNTAAQPLDFYSMLKTFKDGKEERLPDQELNGRKVQVFKITRSIPTDGGSGKSTALTLWVDPATDLPVQAESSSVGGHGTLSNLKFDGEISDSLFDMTIPATYAVSDVGGLRADQLKAAPTTQEAEKALTLLPGVGIGLLKFGDTHEKVVAALGQPEQEIKGFDLHYPSRGVYLMVHPKTGLISVMVMSKKAAGPFAVNDFKGSTDKGIAMDATRAQIEAAYGKPSKVTAINNSTDLEYEKLGINFTLFDGHLVRIFMTKLAK